MSDATDPPEDGWKNFEDGKVIESADSTRERDWGPRLIIAGLALLAAVLFIVQNSNRVRTEFLIFDFKPRLWVVIVFSMLLGALLGQAVGLRRRRGRKAKSDD
ncbi:MAG TPA: LapA family protein [Acidimicrobiales bacterium]|nr:LapA family protein [Acidimicrobiales bacterium]